MGVFIVGGIAVFRVNNTILKGLDQTSASKPVTVDTPAAPPATKKIKSKSIVMKEVVEDQPAVSSAVIQESPSTASREKRQKRKVIYGIRPPDDIILVQ